MSLMMLSKQNVQILTLSCLSPIDFVCHGNNQQILSGNTDTYTVKKNRLDLPIVGANVIRIVPFSQHLRTVCLRFELHGCPLKGKVHFF